MRVFGIVLFFLTLTGSAFAGAASQIAVNAGNNQTVPANTAVPVLPSVLVTDSGGQPVAGVSVMFAVSSGGGTITGAGPVLTDASGIAMVGSWTLGVAPGSNSIMATSTGLTGSPVLFTATGTGTAATIQIYLGNNQTAPSGAPVAFPPCVIVKDSGGTAVANVPVTFAVTGGGGSVSDPQAVSNAGGIAIVGSWTLGTTPGTNTLTATSPGLTGSPVLFTATATSPLAFISGPVATPSFANVGQVVTFTVVSNVDPTTYTWNFGDGTGDNSGSGSVQHSYAVAGTYNATVIATTAISGGQVNSASTPVLVFLPVPMTLTKKALKAANPSASKDTIQLQGSLVLPDGTTRLPGAATVNFGGLKQSFALTKGNGKSGQSTFSIKGKVVKNVLTSTAVTFKIKLIGNLSSVLTNAGLAAGTSGSVSIPLQILFTSTTYAANGTINLAITANGKSVKGL